MPKQSINEPQCTLPQYSKKVLEELKIVNPECVTTKQAALYLSQIKGIPTAPSSLEVYRSTSRGPKFKKINSRVFYTLPWLDEHANGVEVRIYDPSKQEAAA